MQKRTTPEDAHALKEIEQSQEFKNREVKAVQKYFRIAVKPFFCDPSLAERADFTFGENTAKNQGAVAELLMKDLGSYDIHDRLSLIKCPTLIVHGDSELLPCEIAYKVHKHIPGSKFVVLKKTGHFMFIESPEDLFSIIRRFLKDDKTVENSIPGEIEERLWSVSF